MDVRHHVEIGDEVKTVWGGTGIVKTLSESLAGVDIDGEVETLHVNDLARIHPKALPALLHWEDAELVELWINMPANTRGGVKALAYARLVLAGKPRK